MSLKGKSQKILEKCPVHHPGSAPASTFSINKIVFLISAYFRSASRPARGHEEGDEEEFLLRRKPTLAWPTFSLTPRNKSTESSVKKS